MSIRVITQGTPNPNALKFILAKDVKIKGKVTYTHPAECLHVPLAANLLGITHVSEVHFFENVVTITQDGEVDWQKKKKKVIETLREMMPDHNPNFDSMSEHDQSDWNEERKKLEDILDREVRPGLQADGGDLQVMEYTDNILTVKYEGACGNCPSSRFGTLQGIESILRHEFNPEIQIAAID